MREFNLLKSYPQPEERLVGNRTIHHRMLASYRGWHFFDGPREYGYGGLEPDGRWKLIARDICAEYKPKTVLQLNCEKGYLIEALHELGVTTKGVDSSSYARTHCTVEIQPGWMREPEPVDLIIAIGVVYTLPLGAAMDCIRRIEQSSHRSFITLAAYDTDEDLKLLKAWSLLACTILKKEEWIEVLNHCGFTGDYHFVTAEYLKLKWSLSLVPAEV